MIRIRDIAISPRDGNRELIAAAARVLKSDPSSIRGLKIRKKSVDARKKHDIKIVYTVDVAVSGDECKLCRRLGGRVSIAEENRYVAPVMSDAPEKRPVIVGFGPAGIFAALVLSMAGAKPIVLEQGCDVDERTRKVSRFWEEGKLDTRSNVQFGEGGAGTFSDGKLNTGINDERIEFVLRSFYEAGADENILWDSKPHIGTDVLRTVVKNLREKIISLGGQVRFLTKAEKLIISGGKVAGLITDSGETIDCDRVIIATGHSARHTFSMLADMKVPMESKAFSMGVRIEHLQSDINFAQYGDFEDAYLLPPADYKLNCRFSEGDSAYTFCMCPGGYVVAAASEDGRLCTNGMSERARDGRNANSAILVTLTPDMFPYKGIMGGVRWQREIEERAFVAGGGDYCAPAQLVRDFLENRPSTGAGKVIPTYRPGVKWCSIDDVLPGVITDTLRKAIPEMGKRLNGFDDGDAVLTAPETRSSSPVRITRGADMQSDVRGLFPCGEGAGYAGGIMSAAVDGIKCAEALIASL